jgi:hypothetical protein
MWGQDRAMGQNGVVVKTYWRQLCRQKGLGNEPRPVIDELSQIRMVDVELPTRSGLKIRRRCISQPTEHQAILLHHLGLNLPPHLPVAEQKMNQM